jgi:hypothetical protein
MPGTWRGLANQPAFSTSTMMLLTDGRVMVQEEGTNHWHALTPDHTGSYVSGTWSPLADMSIWRRYYASGVLDDGRVIVVGGEQSGAGGDTNRGEIYDPVTDSWAPISPPPGWATVGDAASCILPDGRLMIGALSTPECAIYDHATDSWSAAASKAIRSNEETWILLPDETIVTVQCFRPFHAEKYVVSSNAWKPEGAPPVQLVDPVMSEIGPAMLMYDGRVIYFGAANVHGSGKTAIYTPPAGVYGTGSWAQGPDIPTIGKQAIVCNDCPAALLPNGKVLFAAAPWVFNFWGSPVHFFEYDPATNLITQAPDPPNNGSVVFMSRLMLLPTGEVLFSPNANVQCYLPDGAPREAWRPTISALVVDCDPCRPDHYLLRGTQLTGLSQANVYGDDCHPATNYPLVRLRSHATGDVRYCRTYDFSSMGVATGATPQSVRFEVSGLPYGRYDLCVVANGISSHCVDFCHAPRRPCGCQEERCDSCRKERCEPMRDPEVLTLRAQVRSLQASLRRFSGQEQPQEDRAKRREVHDPEASPAEEESSGHTEGQA